MNKLEKQCLLCCSEEVVELYKDHPGFQEQTFFDIQFCISCNTSYSLPRKFDTSFLYQQIYQYQDRIPGYDRYWRYYKEIKNYKNPLEYLSENDPMYWGVQKALIEINEYDILKAIEIGSGLGYLTYALNKFGIKTTGLDISKPAVDSAKKMFGDYYICEDVFKFSDKNKTLFDIVILNEVIEHVNDPKELIKVLLKLLNINGKIILTTPNKSIYPNDVIWATENPPIHFWWLSEKSLEYIAKSLNLRISFVDFTDYYRKHYKSISIDYMRKRIIPRPVLTESGELIFELSANIKKSNPLRLLRSRIYEINAINNIYNKAKDYNKKDLIKCNKRGTTICAILEIDKHLY